MLVNSAYLLSAERVISFNFNEVSTVSNISNIMNQNPDLNSMLTATLDEILRNNFVGQLQQGTIYLYEPAVDILIPVVSRGITAGPSRVPDCIRPNEVPGPSGWIYQQRQFMFSTLGDLVDTYTDQNIDDIWIPISTQDDVLGIMHLSLIVPTRITEGELILLSIIVDQLALAIRINRLREEVHQREQELNRLRDMAQVVTDERVLDAALQTLLLKAHSLLTAQGFSVLLHDPSSDGLFFAAVTGPDAEQLLGQVMPLSSGFAGWVYEHQVPLLIDNAQGDQRFYDSIDEITGTVTETLLVVPLLHNEKSVGVIEAINKQGRTFDQHDLELLSMVADLIVIELNEIRLRKAEQEQRDLYERSYESLIHSEKLAATGRLSASLAHEMNNPLQALHNSLQVILSYPLSTEEQQEYLQMAKEEVERLISMSNRVLDFSRSSQHRVSPTDVNEVIHKVLTLANKYLQHHGVVLQRALTPNLPLVMANAGELGQVFLNLIMNAVDAMSDGGQLLVNSSMAENHGIVVEFTDNGVGIPQEILEHLFEPFYSTKENGNGLGLHISHNLVQRHDGDIRVDTVSGQGTTFSIWLPCSDNSVISEGVGNGETHIDC